jgi:superfamily II DNA or RNA helicase
VYRALAGDAARTAQIVEDIRAAVARGRSPLVLTERRDHLDALASGLRSSLGDTADVFVLSGGMRTPERRAAWAALGEIGARPRVVLSTGRYLGEGFDDARLDAPFLAMSIAWKGTLAQYIGRLHREHTGKRDVVVYDYVDGLVAVLARMGEKRQAGYRALGYVPRHEP